MAGLWVFWYGSTTDQWEAAVAIRGAGRGTGSRRCRSSNRGVRAVPDGQLIDLRYEDFVADPVGRLAEIRGWTACERGLAGRAALSFP